jgi:predicted phosphoribosyltransferase
MYVGARRCQDVCEEINSVAALSTIRRTGLQRVRPLTPVIAKFYMEHFEQKAVSTASKKPTRWYRYVDDIFAEWSHGKNDLQDFLQHLNNIHKSIEFTMEAEQDRTLPFLDVLV